MAAPIRVGFIGLSSNPNAHLAGAWGRNAHLPYLRASEKYTIVALCNSSVESAKKAIEVYDLDAAKVQAYGDPTSLANDANVDLVVCSVSVMDHYDLVKPALQAGKMVFCEWPLASNLAQMKELAEIAEKNKCKTILGLQGRMGVYVNAVRGFVGDGEGKLGDVLSTSFTAYGLINGMASPGSIKYLLDIKTGGNVFTISGIHQLDTLTAALGPITSSHTILRNKRPTIALLDDSFQLSDPAFPNNTPEHVLIHGELASAGASTSTIPFSFQLRGGPAFKDTPTVDWRIYCQRGEIRLSSNEQLWLAGGLKFQVFDFVSQSVKDVEPKEFADKDDVAVRNAFEAPVDNVARLYEALADGRTDTYLGFQQSLKWAEFIADAYAENGF